VDIDTLQRADGQLEQQIAELRAMLEDRDRELATARAANREMIRVNSSRSMRNRPG
jgi:hypothetical protein